MVYWARAYELFVVDHLVNRCVWKCFGDGLIEDCWLNYFCITTNITHSRMEIHRAGYIW